MTDNNQPASSADKEKKDLYKEAQDLVAKEGIEEVVELESAPETEAPSPASDDHQKIKAEIENTLLDDDAKQQAQTHANDLQSLETQEKIAKLLQVAKQKGVVFAVAVAKKMNDPYILDTFHDALAKEGHYKDFLK